jgi:prepilin signal peptidase PulO-like enzyme (type II secretory pathway)
MDWSDFVVYLLICASWTYLSWEDQKYLSVPTFQLYLIAVLTAFFGICNQSLSQPLILYISGFLVCSLMLHFYQLWSGRQILGGADSLAILALGVHLNIELLGVWLALSGGLGLISYATNRLKKSDKIPFLPYITIAWMCVVIGLGPLELY